MHEKLSTDTQPLNYFNALSAVRDVLRENRDIYLVNEGQIPRIMHEILLICINHVVVWIVALGCHGHRYGYAIGASVTSGSPVVAIEGDSALVSVGWRLKRFVDITCR